MRPFLDDSCIGQRSCVRVGSLSFLVYLHYCYELVEGLAGDFTHGIGLGMDPGRTANLYFSSGMKNKRRLTLLCKSFETFTCGGVV